MVDHVEWRGVGADIQFTLEDFEVIELTLGLMPELRICALAVKKARAAKVQYPLTGAEDMAFLLDSDGKFEGGGHSVRREDLTAYLHPEYFPIKTEAELVSRVYLGLRRCSEEFAMANHLHPHTLQRMADIRASQGPPAGT